MEVITKKNYEGYVDYFYPRAAWLEENCLIGNINYTSDWATQVINDDLMQHNPNYNCVSRVYEGFNNVIEDLWNLERGRLYPKRTEETKELISRYRTNDWDETTWFWVFLFHRVTGSGFSGEADHGYRNSIVTHFGTLSSPSNMMEFAKKWKSDNKPMFSCKGNIPPHPKKGTTLLETMCAYQYRHCSQLFTWLTMLDKRPSIREVTDKLNEMNKLQGMHKWNFAFSMMAADIAQYFPRLVDPMSDLYCGSNAMDSIIEMFERPKGMSKDELYTYGLQNLTDRLGTSPMAHEDTLCIYKRFLHGISRNGDYKSNSGYIAEYAY